MYNYYKRYLEIDGLAGQIVMAKLILLFASGLLHIYTCCKNFYVCFEKVVVYQVIRRFIFNIVNRLFLFLLLLRFSDRKVLIVLS